MNSRCAIAVWLECFQEKPSWCRNEQVCQGRKSVKRFERSNGLDTALYKNIPLPFFYLRKGGLLYWYGLYVCCSYGVVAAEYIWSRCREAPSIHEVTEGSVPPHDRQGTLCVRTTGYHRGRFKHSMPVNVISPVQ